MPITDQVATAPCTDPIQANPCWLGEEAVDEGDDPEGDGGDKGGRGNS